MRLVAYKLQEFFGVIGYPIIFHTDNGKEFTAKVILRLRRVVDAKKRGSNVTVDVSAMAIAMVTSKFE